MSCTIIKSFPSPSPQDSLDPWSRASFVAVILSRPFVSDTSPKCIYKEDLERRSTFPWSVILYIIALDQSASEK